MPQTSSDMPQQAADTTAVTAPAPAAHAAATPAAADSAATRPSWAPVPFASCSEAMAPFSAADKALYHTSAPGWLQGVDAPLRHGSVADNPVVLSLLVGIFVLAGLGMGHVRRLFRSLPQRLWSVRRRGNAFDDTASNETPTFLLLLLMLCVSGGILLYKWLGHSSAAGVSATVCALAALTAGYYIFQICAGALVGYVFADRGGASSWMRGLNAAAALLGVALMLPAVVALFYPGLCGAMLVVAALAYISVRIVLIVKGFRIFYNNFLSLLYFILYLCTLEIIPVIVLYVSATEICKTL